MPIYEYACGSCDHRFEEWQKMSDPPVRKCPRCKRRKVEKLISATAFVLKGGGWGKDLYSSQKPANAADPKGDAKPDPKPADAAGESKPAEGAADSKADASSDKPDKKAAKASGKSSKSTSKTTKAESAA